MLNTDLQLENNATMSQRQRKQISKRGNETDSAFHFIAFVPVGGQLWKLDGLDPQPRNLGLTQQVSMIQRKEG